MYVKPISFLGGSNNLYGIIFNKMYLIPWLTTPPPPFFAWYCVIRVLFYLAGGPPQHLYQGMQKYVVIG